MNEKVKFCLLIALLALSVALAFWLNSSYVRVLL